MPVPPLDFPVLIAPIPGESPAGINLPFDVKAKLDEDRKEIENAVREEDNKKADWPAVVKLAQETLVKTSKHFRPAARLTEALVKLNGYGGLREGLHLMRLMIENCWDRMHPELIDADAWETRVGDFFWLDDPERGSRFPNTIKMVPLFGSPPQYSIMEMQIVQGILKGTAPLSWTELEKVIRTTKPEGFHQAVQDMGESLQEVDQISRGLNVKMEQSGMPAPGLNALRQSLEACNTVAKQLGEKYFPRPVPGAVGAGSAATQVNGPGGVGGEIIRAVPQAPVTREEAYKQLAEAASLLKRLEPHSPIPYLVERAINLGGKPFPEMIKELVREKNVLLDLNRLMGIKEGADKDKE
jgi:type VI secretion system protein ImpA